MSDLSLELLIIFFLLIVNGVFAMAEIAVVSARKARLKHLADEGSSRARLALEIAQDPMRFLSTVQIGVTLLGALTGVFGGAELASRLDPYLSKIPHIDGYAHTISLAIVVVAVTLATVVIGELGPKRIGMSNPEGIAMVLAPTISRFSRLFAPVVTCLTYIVDRGTSLIGIKQGSAGTPISEEEVNILIEQGLNAGVFNKTEKEMVAGVLELDQLPVTALMTPRPKIIFLNLDDSEDVNWRKVVASGHSYFPVYQGNRDQVVGMVAVKALWAHSAIGLSTNLKNLLVPPLIVPETMTSIQLLESFKKSGKHIALISDEFGAIQGLVTLIDVLEAIVGTLPTQGRRNTPDAKQREDGSWLIDATLPIDDVKTMLKLGTLPHEDEAEFQTLGGFVVTQFGRIPSAGDYFDHGGWRFEIVDMDRHRVDKVLVSQTAAPAALQKAAS